MSPGDTRRRILVLAERLPRGDESSGSARFLALLTILAERSAIALWVERDETVGRSALAPERVAADRERLERIGVRVIPLGWPALRDALLDEDVDAVLFEFHHVAARYATVVRDLHPRAKHLVDSVDLHFARLAAGAELGVVSRWASQRVRRAELATYRAADGVIVVSDEDARQLAAEGSMPPTYVVPNVPAIRPRALGARACEVLFVGHFHHAPNVDGIGWFVREIWPRLVELRPEALLTIVGTYAPREVRAYGSLPGIRMLGYVPEVAPLLDRAAVAIAPLRYGAGMKGKVTDAMAAGVPVVTTSVGAQGLAITSSTHARVADDAGDFAAAVADLLDDPQRAEAIGLAGQAHVVGICSPERVAPTLHAMLDEVLTPPASASASAFARRRDPIGKASALASRLRVWRIALRSGGLAALRRHGSPLLAVVRRQGDSG